jgi:carotenoid cleavage dioxygenase-like enzyme
MVEPMMYDLTLVAICVVLLDLPVTFSAKTVVLASRDFTSATVARIELPRIPLDLHGNWIGDP